MNNRVYVPIWKAAEAAEAINPETGEYEWAMVEIDNMGWCKDGTTRWYHFTAEAEAAAVVAISTIHRSNRHYH